MCRQIRFLFHVKRGKSQDKKLSNKKCFFIVIDSVNIVFAQLYAFVVFKLVSLKGNSFLNFKVFFSRHSSIGIVFFFSLTKKCDVHHGVTSSRRFSLHKRKLMNLRKLSLKNSPDERHLLLMFPSRKTFLFCFSLSRKKT